MQFPDEHRNTQLFEGVLRQKVSSNSRHRYQVNSQKRKRLNYEPFPLIEMTWGSNKMHFTYDSNGPMSVLYNGTEYFYLKNAQGDITGMVDTTGSQVVSYSYNAWGDPVSTEGSMKDTLGAGNPFRYRSYVYDAETDLYYLNSRYYNPTWGRFLNVDGYASTGQGITGNNMFAYCNDNPVNHVDEDGTFALSSILISAAVSGIVSAIATAVTGGSAEEVLSAALVSALFSGITALKGADIVVRVFLSITSGMMAWVTCRDKGVSMGRSLLCGFVTSITTLASSMLSVWIKDAADACMTELTFGTGWSIAAAATGMSENTSSKNGGSQRNSWQNTSSRKPKQSPVRLPYYKLFTYRPEFV